MVVYHLTTKTIIMKSYIKLFPLVVLLFITSLVTTNCGNSNYSLKNESGESYGGAYNDAILEEVNEDGYISQEQSTVGKPIKKEDKTANSNQEDYERKLIKRGHLSFETKDVNETTTRIKNAVKVFNGYISDENQTNYSESKNQSLQIRISSDSFDAFIEEVSKGVKKFDSKNITVQDVSEEFYDVQARLKTKKEIEANYIELLKKAKTVEDILSVERELGYIRTEIESMQGRLKYLGNQVSMSTVNISFYQNTHSKIGFFGEIVDGFKRGWKGFLNFLIGLVHIWPAILIIGLILFLVVRWRKNKSIDEY